MCLKLVDETSQSKAFHNDLEEGKTIIQTFKELLHCLTSNFENLTEKLK